MSNAMDLLLKLDKTKLVRPTQEVEIKRLSDISGEPFVVNCQALAPDKFEELQNSTSISTDGEIKAEKNVQAKYIIAGLQNPDFGNLQVIEYYGVTSAVEAVNKVFLPGEATGLFNIINKLSGFGKGTVEEIKNESTETVK